MENSCLQIYSCICDLQFQTSARCCICKLHLQFQITNVNEKIGKMPYFSQILNA